MKNNCIFAMSFKVTFIVILIASMASLVGCSGLRALTNSANNLVRYELQILRRDSTQKVVVNNYKLNIQNHD